MSGKDRSGEKKIKVETEQNAGQNQQKKREKKKSGEFKVKRDVSRKLIIVV